MILRSRDFRLLTLVAVAIVYVRNVEGHVALTFPPARKYDLDFLDNSRTKPPCGMPKGATRTSILQGSKFNVTWHLAYPHRGGFSLDILDHLERPILDLTPTNAGSKFVIGDVTAQSFEIHLDPDFVCENCTIRLQRQADEWSGAYRFWSCADVDIKPRKIFKETCSGHGKWFATQCKCDKNYFGSRCQYQNECNEDRDCGIQGKCIDHGGSSLPRKQCYCRLGFFGPGCNKKSPFRTTEVDYSLYKNKQLSPDFKLHWRILEESKEIEVVMQANSTTWIAVGWRPRRLNAECKNFPLIGSATSYGGPEVTAEPEPTNSAEPTGEPEGKSEPTSEPTGEPEGKSEPTSEPKSEPASEPSSEPKGEPTGEPAAEPTSEPTKEPAAEPEPSKTKQKRAGTDDVPSVDKVATSVSYKVSAVQGNRQRRETQTAEPEPTSEAPSSELETTSEPEPTTVKAEPEPSKEPPSSEPEPTKEAPSSEPEPTKEGSSSEPEPTKENPSSEPEPTKETPLSEPEVTGEPEPTTVRTHEAIKAEPEPSKEGPSAEVTSEPEISAESEPEPTTVKTHENIKAEPEPEPTKESVPEPEVTSEPEIAAESEPSSQSKAKLHLNEYTPRHDFNPMDCTDIVIGTARDQFSRVGDYYTRDRSTPRLDTFWGGVSDLTATGGFEKDGVTTILFRKKLTAIERSDHSIENDLMHVIWAKGQEPGKYVHFPPSGLEKQAASNKEFYQADELKYHGHSPQRGALQLNFYEEEKKTGSSSASASVHLLDNDCKGHWRTPSACSPEKENCEYYISWETVGRGDEMHFHIESNSTNTWTGVGFSDDRKMSQTDAIIGWVDNYGRPFFMDTWINGYSAPRLDDSQDIYNTSGRIKNGITVLDFYRKRESGDQKDLSFTEDHCLYMMFPVNGGSFHAVNKKITKHESIPVVPERRICIKSCGKELADLNYMPSTPAPNRLVYAFAVKLMNLAQGFEAPPKGTPEFNNLADTLSNSFNGVLEKIEGFNNLEVVNFEKNANEIIAKMNAHFDKDNYEKGRSLKDDENELDQKKSNDGDIIERAIKDSLAAGKVGSLTVDPNYLDFVALEYKQSDDSDKETLASFFQLSELRLYIVLGLIAALVFVVIVQATYTIYKTTRSKNRQKDHLISNSAWKDYPSNTNYAFDAFNENEHSVKPTAKPRGRSSGTNGNGNSQQTTLQMREPPNKGHYYEQNRNGRHHPNGDHSSRYHDRAYHNGEYIPRSSYGERTYSLPRQMAQHQNHPGYYTQDRRSRPRDENTKPPGSTAGGRSNGTDTPDFYYLPSQRKYSGEVVRVYVDYNKDQK